MTKKNDTVKTQLAVMANDIKHIKKDVEDIIDDSAGLEFFIGKELREHFRKRSA